MSSSAGTSAKDGVTTSLSGLSINTANKKKPKSAPVADSWEDEDVSESEDGVAGVSESQKAVPSAPPPTPMDPSFHAQSHQQQQQQAAWAAESESSPSRRPEKTDAVARRMIAAGLGLKAPKQTEEQKEYQKAIREQEKKRRQQEKADEQKRLEEAEKAKASVWED